MTGGTECEIVYEKNKWVKPEIKNSKLFVFSTRQAARIFAKVLKVNFCDIQIYKVKVKNPVIMDLYQPLCYLYDFNQHNVKEVWDMSLSDNYKHDPFHAQDLPKRTVLVDEVKLIERIR